MSKEEDDNETIVILKLDKKTYRTAWNISRLLGFESFDDYVSECVDTNVRQNMHSAGSLELEDIADLKNKLVGTI